MIEIVDAREDLAEAMAAMLRDEFAEQAPEAWPTIEAARDEVREAFAPDRVCRVAIEDGEAAGWIGGISAGYGGRVWELHPLVVRASHRRRGLGSALVEDLERIVGERGAITLTLGSDDETDATSLGGIDLYPDPLAHLARITDRRGHPFGFYLRVGFVFTGVMPDANGFGKPDIFMSKRVAR